MKKWRCTVCGYIHEGETPPDKCPVCGAPKEDFELIEDETSEDPGPSQAQSETEADASTDQAWKCQICGYVHQGAAPPKKCPVCKADADQFQGQPVDAGSDGAAPQGPRPKTSPLSGKVTMQSLERTIKPKSRLVAISELLTRLHGHPIAVHIPNGLLPVSILFTLLAILFNSEPLAVAAKYNCIFVAVSMPVVLITGFIDWFNRFNGKLTSYFKIKLLCGLIVTVLTLVLALWWTTNPDIYRSTGLPRLVFLMINFIDFAAAAVAGFYGGKLVFKE